MRRLRTLRGRVALAAVAATSVVVVLIGVLNAYGSLQEDRQELDAALRREAVAIRAVLAQRPDAELPESGRALPDGSFIRLVEGTALVGAAGDAPAGSLPVSDGYSAVTEGTQRWRTYTVPAEDGLLQVGRDLRELRQPLRARARRNLALGVAALGAVAAAGWSLGGLALRPLARLRAAADRVASTRDLSTRVEIGDGPVEVEELADRLNVMLARLEESAAATTTALEATRRFAGDAGHELRTPLTSMRANLDVLSRGDLEEEQRRAIVGDVVREQARLVALLDALQALARGDAIAATTAPSPVDLAEIVGGTVEAARRRHYSAIITYEDPGEIVIAGSPEGLRILAGNLVENAVLHGRPGGRTEVSLSADGERVALRVDDDGPGIPVGERERIFERFARGSHAAANGSGLGLALVTQQAALHGGTVTVGDSHLGGARFTVTLSANGRPGADLGMPG